MPAGIGFDVDHTLVIDNKLERVAFLHLLEFLLEHGGHTMGTLAHESARIDELLTQQRSGAFTIEEAVHRFVLEHGVTPNERHVERFQAKALAMVAEFVVPSPGARHALTRLRERGVQLAVLSNGWNPLQQVKARRAGFDGPVLASSDLGAQKPTAAAFAALLEALGTPPERTWYVGDDPHLDVAGAAAAGLVPIWFDADGLAFPRELPAPAARLTRLDELPALLVEAVAS